MEPEARCARDGGFVFATPTNLTAGESFEKKTLGAGESMQFEVAFVEKGTPVFLMNSSTQCIVFGILSSDSEYPSLLNRDAWVKSLGLPPGSETPAPLQIKYKQIMNCKPLKCDDEELMTLLGRDKPLCEGALTAPETARLMEILARRQYLSNVATFAKELAAQANAAAAAAAATSSQQVNQPVETATQSLSTFDLPADKRMRVE